LPEQSYSSSTVVEEKGEKLGDKMSAGLQYGKEKLNEAKNVASEKMGEAKQKIGEGSNQT
jgi:hypothetical protein